MATVVTAQKNDTLCTLGINNGFPNCLPLRALPANAALLTRALVAGDLVTIPDVNPSDTPKPVDNLHKFTTKGREVGIRFVHGSRNLPFDQDLELTTLNISNFTTNLAGATEAAQFPAPTAAGFNANADVDSDSFKVEIIETRPPGAQLEVIVEPLLGTYDAAENLTGHANFPGDPKNSGTVRGFRSLIGHAFKVQGKRFRTGYLRLVVDDQDAASRTQQVVLVTDNVSNGDRVAEILDQDIRAAYVLQDCPVADPATKCRVETVAQIGRGRVLNVSLQVLRATPTGIVEIAPGGPGDNGFVKLADIRRHLDVFCRRTWAQDLVKFKTLLNRTVDFPSNMLTVSDLTGNLATGVNPVGTGAGNVGFTLLVQRFGVAADATHVVAPIAINAGDAPQATAARIITAIGALPGLTATPSINPAEDRGPVIAGSPPALGSVDILIKDAQNGRITITNLSGINTQDSTQIVTASDLSQPFQARHSLTNFHVGSPQQRNLYKMLDTGDDRVDIFVVPTFSGEPTLVGLTLSAQSDLDASRRPMSGMFNTVVMRQDSVDSTDTFPYAMPHELGHVLLDCALHADNSRQLMFPTVTAAVNDVNDAKRLTALDPPATNWENVVSNAALTVGTQRIRMNTLTRVSDKSGGILHS